MFNLLLADSLVKKQLDEENIEAAVEDRGHCSHQGEVRALGFGAWEDWDGAREGGKDKVEEETEAKETDVESVAVWAVVPQEFPDSEEANANCDDSSEVQDAVLNLRVDIYIY